MRLFLCLFSNRSLNFSRVAVGLALLCMCGLAACTSSILSKNTDDQAWIDQQKDSQMSEISIRQIVLSCSAPETAQSCYETKLSLAFDESFRRSHRETANLTDVDYQKQRQEYLKNHPYAQSLEQVKNFHQLLLSGMELRAADHIHRLIRECKSGTEAASCLKAKRESDATQLLTETTERLGLTIASKSARTWILEKQIYPVYDELAHSLLSRHPAQERVSP
jgi:hypothetical protein